MGDQSAVHHIIIWVRWRRQWRSSSSSVMMIDEVILHSVLSLTERPHTKLMCSWWSHLRLSHLPPVGNFTWSDFIYFIFILSIPHSLIIHILLPTPIILSILHEYILSTAYLRHYLLYYLHFNLVMYKKRLDFFFQLTTPFYLILSLSLYLFMD
jgi:hypothetical protein